MPYRIEGSRILHYKNGRWTTKQRCKNHKNAVNTLRLLQGLEHGTIKKADVGVNKLIAKEQRKAGK